MLMRLVVLSLVGASGYVVPRCHVQRARVPLAVAEDVSIVSNKIVDDIRECLVDAENAEEQADCLSANSVAMPAATTAASRSVDTCIVEAEKCVVEVAHTGPADAFVPDVRDCGGRDGSAEEIAACADTTLGTTYEDCIVNAENAAEIDDCGTYKASHDKLVHALSCTVSLVNTAYHIAPPKVRPSLVLLRAACDGAQRGNAMMLPDVDYEDCIVNAENAAEIADCKGEPTE